MAQISDRTLISMMLVALVVTVGSVGMIFFKAGGVNLITGLNVDNTSTGEINITVEEQAAVTLIVGGINFGAGSLDSASSLTFLNTSGTHGAGNGTFEGVGFGSNLNGSFQLQNDGNVYVNVSINGTSPDDFFGITGGNMNYSYGLENTSAIESLSASCSNFEGGSNKNDELYYASPNSTQTSGITFDAIHQIVCPNMSYADANDSFNVSIFLAINISVFGDLNTTVEFLATSLGHG